MKKYYNYNDGDYIDEDISEIIQYMFEDDIPMEDIIGTTLDVGELTNIYSDKDYLKIQDIIYGEADLYCDEKFQRQRTEIMKMIEDMKYLEPVSKYVITEEDWNDFMGVKKQKKWNLKVG